MQYRTMLTKFDRLVSLDNWNYFFHIRVSYFAFRAFRVSNCFDKECRSFDTMGQ